MMDQDIIDTETEELYKRKHCKPQRVIDQSRYNLARGDFCSKCEKVKYESDLRENTQRRRKSRNRLQHCPSCHCPPDLVRLPFDRTRNSENVEAVLQRYEHLLEKPASFSIKKSQSGTLSPRLHFWYHQMSNHPCCSKRISQRNQRRSEQEELMSNMLNDMIHRGLVNEETKCCYKLQSGRSPVRRIPYLQQSSSEENSDCDFSERYVPQPKSRAPKVEPRATRKNACTEKHIEEPVENEEGTEKLNDDWRRQMERDYQQIEQLEYEVREYEKLKDLSRTMNEAGDEERRKVDENPVKRQNPPNRTPVTKFGLDPRSSILKTKSRDEQNKTKSRIEADIKCRIPTEENCNELSSFIGCSKDEQLRKQLEDIVYCEISQRSPKKTQSASQEQLKIEKRNEEEQREETKNIATGQKQNEEVDMKRNVYAGGDFDLHASKSHILDLIDKALSREFGGSNEEKKNEISADVAQQELCIEITRALQDCQLQPQMSIPSSQNYLKLKILRWEYLNHIREEFKKLYDLEAYLDSCSPRPNFSQFQDSEQRIEQEQQQEHPGTT